MHGTYMDRSGGIMNLCIDVGNSTIQFGLFIDSRLEKKFAIATNSKLMEHDLNKQICDAFSFLKIERKDVNAIIYSSVVPSLNYEFKKTLAKLFQAKVINITSGIKTGVMMKVDNPSEVGNDLVADLVGAKSLYGYPCIIIDLGTASKILLIDDKGIFDSVLIMPGIKKSAEILTNSTSLLPEISLEKSSNFLAKNTIEAMNNGIIYGHAEMIKGLVKRFLNYTNDKCKIILTGGCANIIKDLLPSNYIFDEDLNLKGLNIILNKNRGAEYA